MSHSQVANAKQHVCSQPSTPTGQCARPVLFPSHHLTSPQKKQQARGDKIESNVCYKTGASCAGFTVDITTFSTFECIINQDVNDGDIAFCSIRGEFGAEEGSFCLLSCSVSAGTTVQEPTLAQEDDGQGRDNLGELGKGGQVELEV